MSGDMDARAEQLNEKFEKEDAGRPDEQPFSQPEERSRDEEPDDAKDEGVDEKDEK